MHTDNTTRLRTDSQQIPSEFTNQPVVPAGVMTTFDQAAWLKEKESQRGFWERRRKSFQKSREKKKRRAEREAELHSDEMLNGELHCSNLPGNLDEIFSLIRLDEECQSSLTPFGNQILSQQERRAA